MDKNITRLLSNYQVLIALALMVVQGLILTGLVPVVESIAPLDAVWSLVVVQALLFANHQLDTLQALRMAFEALGKIDFKDDNIDRLVSSVNAVFGVFLPKAVATKGGFTSNAVITPLGVATSEDGQKRVG